MKGQAPGAVPEELADARWIWSDSSGFRWERRHKLGATSADSRPSGSVPQGSTVRLETVRAERPFRPLLVCLLDKINADATGAECPPRLRHFLHWLRRQHSHFRRQDADPVAGLLLSAMLANVTLFSSSADWTWSLGGAGEIGLVGAGRGL
eukprot:751868-Hanusia_phi.AAC.3